jgi:(2Fe-2S) ferredoxin
MSNDTKRYLVTVCQHRSCSRQGAAQVLAAFQEKAPAPILISRGDCQGQCGSGPTVHIMPDNIWYCHVRPEDVDTIVESHLISGDQPVQHLLNPRIHQTQSTYAALAEQYQAFKGE